ncbi:unnamed protein product [Discosporangium mesarthrocarpum]
MSMTMFGRLSRSLRPVAMVSRRGVQTEAKLESLGYKLPTPKPPLGSFSLCTRTGNMLYTAGHLPMNIDGDIMKGKVGQEVSEEQAKEAAKLVALNLIATLKKEIGDLDKVKRVVKLVGFVNCVDSYTGQPGVVNGASDLFGEVFGERGVHSRSAVGTNALPLDVPVEIEAIVEVED